MQGDLCKLRIVELIPYYDNGKRWFKLFGPGTYDAYCFYEQDLEWVRNLITFIYSTDGQKLKDIITSPDYETQQFGFQILNSFGFEKDKSYEELIYYAFLWS